MPWISHGAPAFASSSAGYQSTPDKANDGDPLTSWTPSALPAWIAYEDPRVAWFGGAAFAPHYARLAQTRHVVARLRFGEPLDALSSDDPGDLAARARARVAAMRPPDTSAAPPR